MRNKRGPSVIWTDEMDAMLGTMPDTAVAQRLGISIKSAYLRRVKMGIPPLHDGASEKRTGRRPALALDEPTLAAISELTPYLIQQINRRGVPLTSLDPAQVITVAVNQLLDAMRKEQTRAQYAAGATAPQRKREVAGK